MTKQEIIAQLESAYKMLRKLDDELNDRYLRAPASSAEEDLFNRLSDDSSDLRTDLAVLLDDLSKQEVVEA